MFSATILVCYLKVCWSVSTFQLGNLSWLGVPHNISDWELGLSSFHAPIGLSCWGTCPLTEGFSLCSFLTWCVYMPLTFISHSMLCILCLVLFFSPSFPNQPTQITVPCLYIIKIEVNGTENTTLKKLNIIVRGPFWKCHGPGSVTQCFEFCIIIELCFCHYLSFLVFWLLSLCSMVALYPLVKSCVLCVMFLVLLWKSMSFVNVLSFANPNPP